MAVDAPVRNPERTTDDRGHDDRPWQVIVLNDTGTMVWGLLAEHGDPAELVRLVHEAYPEIAYADVERDVRTFLDELVAAELIEQV